MSCQKPTWHNYILNSSVNESTSQIEANGSKPKILNKELGGIRNDFASVSKTCIRKSYPTNSIIFLKMCDWKI